MQYVVGLDSGFMSSGQEFGLLEYDRMFDLSSQTLRDQYRVWMLEENKLYWLSASTWLQYCTEVI